MSAVHYAMPRDRLATQVSRPAVFREPGALLYAGNCADLARAAEAGKVALNAWTRRGYPGQELGQALPSVCSVGGWDAHSPQDWGLKKHCNEGVKIAYLARGTLTLTLDEEVYELRAGQMFVVRPWQLHALGAPNIDPSRIVWVLFDMGTRRPHDRWVWPDWLGWPDHDRRRLTEMLSQNEQAYYTASKEVGGLFEDIAALVAKNDIGRDELKLRLIISSMLMQFKAQIEGEHLVLDDSLTASRRTVRIFLDRLAHALDADWTLENMAAECQLSRTQFAHHCQAITNMSPARYLQEVRLDTARKMLASDHRKPVTAIAYDCGFSSSQYFATSFRKRYGVQPSELRQMPASSAA